MIGGHPRGVARARRAGPIGAPLVPHARTEIDLLFGVLALQVGLIDQAALLVAFHARTRDPARSLAQHLVDRGDLAREDRDLVEAMARRHLSKHGGRAEASLAALPVAPSTRLGLAAVVGDG